MDIKYLKSFLIHQPLQLLFIVIINLLISGLYFILILDRFILIYTLKRIIHFAINILKIIIRQDPLNIYILLLYQI